MDAPNDQVLEEKIYQQYNRDGMLETLLGAALLLGGINMLDRGGSGFVGFFPVFAIVLARVWRRRITYPRLGYAQFLVERRAKKRKAMFGVLLIAAIILILSLAGYALTWGSGGDLLAQPHVKIILGLTVCVLFAGIGWIRKNKSLYYVAAVMFALFVAMDLLHHSAGWALLIMGTVLFVAGLIRLILFLRANPRLDGAEGHELHA